MSKTKPEIKPVSGPESYLHCDSCGDLYPPVLLWRHGNNGELKCCYCTIKYLSEVVCDLTAQINELTPQKDRIVN